MLELDPSRALFSGTCDGRPVLFVCIGEDQFSISHGDCVVRRGRLDAMSDGLRQFMDMIDRPGSQSMPLLLSASDHHHHSHLDHHRAAVRYA